MTCKKPLAEVPYKKNGNVKKKKSYTLKLARFARGLDDDNLDSCQIATVYISAL